MQQFEQDNMSLNQFNDNTHRFYIPKGSHDRYVNTWIWS